MLIIAWGLLKYKEVINYFEVLLVHSEWRVAGVHARGLLGSCVSLLITHLFDGEETESHSMHVLLHVVFARWESWLAK